MVLALGPPEEVETVRSIYRAFVEERKPEKEIADDLNRRGIRTDLGRPWTRGTVHQILINEKYVGNNLWNRVSFKLKKKRVRNAPEMWIRAEGAFDRIVDQDLFDAAQSIIRERSRRFSEAEMLDGLRHLLKLHGYLSGLIIDESEHLPSSSAFRSRYGSLLRAYQLVGFTPDRDYRYVEINRFLRQLYPDIVAATVAEIEKVGGHTERDPVTDLMTVNREFTASIVITRCLQLESGALRWNIRFDTQPGARYHCRPPHGPAEPRAVRLLLAAAHRHDGAMHPLGRKQRRVARRVSLRHA